MTKENENIYFDDTSLGMMARIQRLCRWLTKQEISDMAGVSPTDVYLFENNDCLSLITKRKLLRAYNLIVERQA